MCRCKTILEYLRLLNFISQKEGLLQIQDYKDVAKNQKYRCLSMSQHKPNIHNLTDYNEDVDMSVLMILFPDISGKTSLKTKNKKNSRLLVEEVSADNFKLDFSSCKVFVKNIPFEIKQRELWDFFEYFGKVLRVSIIQDRKTKRSRGFGFIIFSSPFDAEKAISAKPYELKLNGRLLVVQKATKQKGRKRYIDVHNKKVPVREKLKDAIDSFLHSTQVDPSSSASQIECCIDKLCDSVIMLIFSYIPLCDRVRCEAVCRRWKILSIQTWSKISHITFNNVFSKSFEGLTDKILISLVKKGCSQLKHLDVSASPFMLTGKSLSYVAKSCKLIEVLDLSQVQINNDTCKVLGSSLLQLKELYLHGCTSVGEKGLWWLLKDLKQLSVLHITENPSLTGKCLYMLHNTIKDVNFNSCHKLSDRALFNLSMHSENLKYMDLSNCLNFTDQGITDLLRNSLNLVHLNLNNISRNVSGAGLMGLSDLKKMTHLDLSQNLMVNDEHLVNISKHCECLRYLNIESCHGNITCFGLSALGEMRLLRHLNISYLMQVCDVCITCIASCITLHSLTLRSCYQLTNKGVARILERCEWLQRLDLSDCIYINNDLTKKVCPRSTDVHLIIFIGGTEVTDVDGLEQKLAPCNVSSQRKSQAILKHPSDITLIAEEEISEEQFSEDEEEEVKSRPVCVLPDDIGFDMSLDYPDIDEYGDKLWEVHYPTNTHQHHTEPQPNNHQNDGTIEKTEAIVLSEEEDWDTEIEEGRYWHIPEMSLQHEDSLMKDFDEDLLDNDDPLQYELPS